MKIDRRLYSSLLLLAFLFVASSFQRLSAQDSSATFMVTNGACPWVDRIGTWQLSDVPASLDGNGPLPQQNCGSRSIVVPAETKYVLIGVSMKDVDKFKTDYPAAQPTGDSISVSHADGTATIPYTVFKLPAPPASVGDPAFTAGLIILQLNDKPAATPAAKPAPAAPAAPSPAK